MLDARHRVRSTSLRCASWSTCFWPSILEPMRTPIIAPTLDLTTHIRATLPPDGLPDQPLLVHNTSIAVEDGFADSDSCVFAADGKLLAQARQLQLLAPFDEV